MKLWVDHDRLVFNASWKAIIFPHFDPLAAFTYRLVVFLVQLQVDLVRAVGPRAELELADVRVDRPVRKVHLAVSYEGHDRDEGDGAVGLD